MTVQTCIAYLQSESDERFKLCQLSPHDVGWAELLQLVQTCAPKLFKLVRACANEQSTELAQLNSKFCLKINNFLLS